MRSSAFDGASGRFSLVLSEGIADNSLRPVDAPIAAQMITALINAAAEEVHNWAPGFRSRTLHACTRDRCFTGC